MRKNTCQRSGTRIKYGIIFLQDLGIMKRIEPVVDKSQRKSFYISVITLSDLYTG